MSYVTFYTATNYGGEAVQYNEGVTVDFARDDKYNDKFQSCRIPSGLWVNAFQNNDASGTDTGIHQELHGDQTDLSFMGGLSNFQVLSDAFGYAIDVKLVCGGDLANTPANSYQMDFIPYEVTGVQCINGNDYIQCPIPKLDPPNSEIVCQVSVKELAWPGANVANGSIYFQYDPSSGIISYSDKGGYPANMTITQDVNGKSATWELSNGGNGHTYKFFASEHPISIHDAIKNCATVDTESLSTIKSYLVTIGSKQEWDFLEKELSDSKVYYRTWLSGTDPGLKGNWVYSTGPQLNQPLFNTFTGQCFGYCAFQTSEPSLTIGEEYLYARERFPWSFNNAMSNNTREPVSYYICEQEPLEEIFASSVGTVGGLVIINNLKSFNIESLNISFFNPTNNISKSCDNITSINSTNVSVTCQVPPLAGIHNIIVRDGNGTKSTQYGWQPFPPFVKAVYPSRDLSGLVTLIGENFGDNSSDVLVAVTRSKIPCKVIMFSTNQIICQLSAPIPSTLKFLPLTVQVAGVYTETYKPNIYCIDKFYSSIRFTGTYETVKKIMNDSIKMEATPIPPYLGVIDSMELYECIKDTIYLVKDTPFYLWLGVNFDKYTNSFMINDGPKNGNVTQVYFERIENAKTSTSTPIYYHLDTKQLNNPRISVESVVSPLIAFGGGLPPVITNTTYLQDNSSTTLTVTGLNFGRDASYVLTTIQGVQCINPKFTEDLLYNKFTCSLSAATLNYTSTTQVEIKYNVTVQVAELVGSIVLVHYKFKECPNNCSGHGVCDKYYGTCRCEPGYDLTLDCANSTKQQAFITNVQEGRGVSELASPQQPTPPPTPAPTPLNKDKEQGVNFTTGINYLREVNHEGRVVKFVNLDNMSWINQVSTNGSVFIGHLDNDSVKMIVKVHQFDVPGMITFAGEDIPMAPFSIKYHIKIVNWTWQSPLNTLQVIFLSYPNAVVTDKCGRKQVKVEASDPGDQVLWTKVQVGRSLLNCKIASRMIVDGDTLPSRVSLLSENDELQDQIKKEGGGTAGFNILTAFHIPHFRSVEIDPAYNALLLGEDDKFNLGDDIECDSFAKWKIIAIVVCGSFILVTLTIALVFITKKRLQVTFSKNLNRNRTTPKITSPRIVSSINQQQQQPPEIVIINHNNNTIPLSPIQKKINDWVNSQTSPPPDNLNK
ncbi:calcium-dependent cell adhesion molecule-1 [Cavenderia fasciculata]|uniref:Calcium-dependent cell adhesion molecule-1 n=1 Tax=Cavenderia fasciculata TaxID=261658 RepID=F4PWD3_CACFS|nr:calcium-dependent cell adhesion molecule-1 [Cavenderia fasciculata]EGG20297.1 calcium-dependent cell adhesion molecule-1 [Cavenderia fasciculata]|eukprot:XP_004367280.1 calcium-dependent cell adhesion molecule-1 [Cavenderia fasciculata]